jgi:hypothetical protein
MKLRSGFEYFYNTKIFDCNIDCNIDLLPNNNETFIDNVEIEMTIENEDELLQIDDTQTNNINLQNENLKLFIDELTIDEIILIKSFSYFLTCYTYYCFANIQNYRSKNKQPIIQNNQNQYILNGNFSTNIEVELEKKKSIGKLFFATKLLHLWKYNQNTFTTMFDKKELKNSLSYKRFTTNFIMHLLQHLEKNIIEIHKKYSQDNCKYVICFYESLKPIDAEKYNVDFTNEKYLGKLQDYVFVYGIPRIDFCDFIQENNDGLTIAEYCNLYFSN